MRRVVITGAGTINPLGADVPATFEAMREGRCGIGPLDIMDVDRLSIQISETDFLVSCVASPICDRSGECVATMSIVLPEHKVIEKRDAYARAVREASEKVERALGWRDPVAS